LWVSRLARKNVPATSTSTTAISTTIERGMKNTLGPTMKRSAKAFCPSVPLAV
jgi:hypothetical protein